MNRRDLFKGIGAMVGGAIAAKAGVPAAARELTRRIWPHKKLAINTPISKELLGVWPEPPAFDLVDTGELTEDGRRKLVPRLRDGCKATFIGEEDSIL